MLKVTNVTSSEIILVGKLLREDGSGDSTYEIPATDVVVWANDDDVITNISSGDVVLSLNDEDILSVSKAIDILKKEAPTDVRSQLLPFADKKLKDGKRVFNRIHGITADVGGARENIDFSIPYPACKINGIQIVGAQKGDNVNFKVLDTPTGTISGVNNAQLNQFGFNVYLQPDYHEYECAYDADLIEDMTIRLEYDSVATDLLPNTVYINFLLHEVK